MIILTVTHPHTPTHIHTHSHTHGLTHTHSHLLTHIDTNTNPHTPTNKHMLNTLSDTFTKAHTCTFLAPSPSHSKSHFVHLSLSLKKLSLSFSSSLPLSPFLVQSLRPSNFPEPRSLSLSHTFSPSKALVHHSQQVSQSIVLLGNNLIGKRCQKL